MQSCFVPHYSGEVFSHSSWDSSWGKFGDLPVLSLGMPCILKSTIRAWDADGSCVTSRMAGDYESLSLLSVFPMIVGNLVGLGRVYGLRPTEQDCGRGGVSGMTPSPMLWDQ